jgi:ribosomal protein RSM22 (predicted rRNA methylase)
LDGISRLHIIIEQTRIESPKQILSQAPIEKVFSKDQFKQIFLKAHPKTWIDRFEDAGKTASTTSMGEIKCYMEHQAKKEPIVSNT